MLSQNDTTFCDTEKRRQELRKTHIFLCVTKLAGNTKRAYARAHTRTREARSCQLRQGAARPFGERRENGAAGAPGACGRLRSLCASPPLFEFPLLCPY